MDVKLFLLVNVAEIHRISRNKSYTSHKTKSISNSRIKIDQLDVTCFIISLFSAQHVSNVSTSIFRSLRLTVNLFHALYCSVRIEVLALASLFSGE
jgi:hypothetical protein